MIIRRKVLVVQSGFKAEGKPLVFESLILRGALSFLSLAKVALLNGITHCLKTCS
jgi:hypothetical protein